MTIRKRLALFCFAGNALFLLLAGLVYVLRPSFMPYHGAIIHSDWPSLSASAQLLYLGMMRTEGAGMLATSLAIAILLWIPFRQGQRWSYWAIAAVGLVEHLPTLAMTFHVAHVTDARPPWVAVLVATLLLVAGLILALGERRPDLRESRLEGNWDRPFRPHRRCHRLQCCRQEWFARRSVCPR